jgi:hypothetical protein
MADEDFVWAVKAEGHLITNKAGASARRQAEELRDAESVRTRLARLLKVHTDERAYRIGGTISNGASMLRRSSEHCRETGMKTADDGLSLLLAEFQQLHDEINNRSHLQSNLLIAALAALGAGLSAAPEFPDATVAVATVITVLSFFWFDHDKHIGHVGLYLATKASLHWPRSPTLFMGTGFSDP